MAEESMEIRIVGDWSEFDREAQRREAQGRSMTFSGEKYSPTGARAITPQQLAIESQIATADRQIAASYNVRRFSPMADPSHLFEQIANQSPYPVTPGDALPMRQQYMGHALVDGTQRALIQDPRTGMIAAAVSYSFGMGSAPGEENEERQLRLGYLGADEKFPGAGTEMMRHVLRLAARTKASVGFEATPAARPFYEKLGFQGVEYDDQFMYASAGDVQSMYGRLGSPSVTPRSFGGEGRALARMGGPGVLVRTPEQQQYNDILNNLRTGRGEQYYTEEYRRSQQPLALPAPEILEGPGGRFRSALTGRFVPQVPYDQSMDYPGGETIAYASYRHRRTGKQYGGEHHGEAWSNAAWEDERFESYDEGFTTNLGRFVNRDEALRIGQLSQQVRPRSKDWAFEGLASEDVTYPDYSDFRSHTTKTFKSAPASPNLPPWVREAMIAEGKNPDRVLNEIDAARPKTVQQLAMDPVAKFLERTNPALADRFKAGDFSAGEYSQYFKESRAGAFGAAKGASGALGGSESPESSLARLSQAAGEATSAIQRLTGAAGGSAGGGGDGGGMLLPPPGAFGGGDGGEPDRRLSRSSQRAYSSGGGSGDRLPPEYIDIPGAPGQALLTGPGGPPANYGQWFGGGGRMPPQGINIPGAGTPGLAAMGGGPAGGGPGATVPGGYGAYRGRFGGGGLGGGQSIWTRNLGGQGLYYATIFGAWEYSKARQADEAAQWQYATAGSDVERLQARLAGVDAATSGVLGGITELGSDAVSGLTFGAFQGPAATRRTLRASIFETTATENARQNYAGIQDRAAIRSVALQDQVEREAMARDVAAIQEKRRLTTEAAGIRPRVENLKQGDFNYLFWSTGTPHDTDASRAAAGELKSVEAQIKEQEDIQALNEKLTDRARGMRAAGVTHMAVQAGAFRALRLGVEDPRNIERNVRQSEANQEISQLYAQGASEPVIKATRLRQDAELGYFDEQTRRQKEVRNIGFQGALVGSAYGAQGNDIQQQFTQLQTQVRQAIAGADSFVEKLRVGMEGAAAIFEFKSRTARAVSGAVSDLGGENEAMGMALSRDTLQARIRSIRTQTSADLRSPMAIFSSEVRSGILERGKMQEQLARQEYEDQGQRIDLQMTTHARILTARENRSPASGRLAQVEGGIQADIQSLQQAGRFDQAHRRAEIGSREVNQFEREYLEGFRGVQFDPRMRRTDNRRDRANPEQVLKDIDESRERIKTLSGETKGQAVDAEERRKKEEAQGAQPVVAKLEDLKMALPMIIANAVKSLIPGN